MSNLDFNNYFDDQSPDDMNRRIRKYRRAVQSRKNPNELPSPDIIEDLVNYCLDNEKFVEAGEFANLWLEYYPYSSEAHTKKGLSALNLDMYETAISSFDNALKFNPNDSEILIYKADALESMNELIIAEQTIEFVLKLDPHNDDAYLIYGSILQKKADYDEAIRIYNFIVESEDHKQEALQELAVCYTILSEYEKAIDCYNQLIDEDPYDFEQWFNLSLVYSYNNQYEKAIDCLDMTLAIEEDYYPAIVQKGDNYSAIGKLAEAIEFYELSTEYVPFDKDVARNLASAYADNEQFGHAIKLFTKLIEKHPYNYQAYFGRGICLDALEQFDSALDDYNRALEFNQSVAELWYAKGDTHYNLSQNYEAITAYKKVIEIDPFNIECMEDLGRLYLDLNMLDYSEEILTECLSLTPNHSEVSYLIGKIHSFNNRFKSAAKYFFNAFSINKDLILLFDEERSDYKKNNVNIRKLRNAIEEYKSQQSK
jgi:tetratricopeptide (TPR) repeat protein